MDERRIRKWLLRILKPNLGLKMCLISLKAKATTTLLKKQCLLSQSQMPLWPRRKQHISCQSTADENRLLVLQEMQVLQMGQNFWRRKPSQLLALVMAIHQSSSRSLNLAMSKRRLLTPRLKSNELEMSKK